MAAKKYSAGAVFLQVVPVFANVQNAIAEHVKDIDKSLGDSMEKSGDKAGRRAGQAASKSMNEEFTKGSGEFERAFRKNIDGINSALEGIDVKKLSNSLRKEVTAIKKELAGLKDVDITVDVDRKKADQEIAELEGRVRAFRDGVKIIFRTDTDRALAGFAKIRAARESVEDPIEIEVHTAKAERQMGTFEKTFQKTAKKAADHLRGSMDKAVIDVRRKLDTLSNARIGIDVSASRGLLELKRLEKELDRLKGETVDIQARTDAGLAAAELAGLNRQVTHLDGKTIRIKADSSSVKKAAKDADQAATSFRSFSVVALAVAGLGPALIPALGGIAAGLIALGPAAAVAAIGLSSVLVGFSGIGDALSALQAKQDSQTQSMQTGAKQEASSARAVQRAREAAAEAIASALDRQKDAQERYRDSIKDVADAEKELAEQRRAHANDGATLDVKIRQNQLNIDQGALNAFDATNTFNAVMADGSATAYDREQARIDMEEARANLAELRLEQKELAEDKKKWDKDGVNGADQVKSAQERLNDAIENQKDAYKDLGEAARDVDKARRDGARSVADALAAQAEQLGAVNAQQANVDAAFDKLGVSGQKFAKFLFALKQDFYDFRDAIQEALLPGIQLAIESFLGSDSGKVLKGLMVDLARGFGLFAVALSKSFQGDAWLGFFQTLADLGPRIMASYATAFIKFMEGLASILTAISPFALQFADALAKMMTQFADWAASPEGQKQITDFMALLASYGPEVMDFLGAAIPAFSALIVALAPLGEGVLSVLTDFLRTIADMDPKLLAGIATSAVALVVASQIAFGVIAFLTAASALFTQAGAIIFGIVGIAVALLYLYKTNEKFRDFIKKAWKAISGAVSEAWNKSLKPALMDFLGAVEKLWKEVLQPFLSWLAPIVIRVLQFLIPNAAKITAFYFRLIAWTITHVLIPVFKFVGFYAGLVGKVFKRVGFEIKLAWTEALKAMKWTWENVLKPVFDFIRNKALPGLENAFQASVDAIGKVWAGLKKVVAAPVKFMLETVINQGLIDGINKVAGWVGAGGKDKKLFGHVYVPPAIENAYATGGVMPGYTPGRDVHTFVSPTAGRLRLSGGEAVMRPEWTAAIGKDQVDYWNAKARSGGVKGVREAMGMGGYWMGGVLPLPGGVFRRHTSGYRGFAGDLNRGSGYDDYGNPVEAWKSGIVAQKNYIGDRSYGRWTVLNHAGGQSSLYAHLSGFSNLSVGDKVRAGQTVGHVGDLGNTGTPPTSHLHFEINGGSVNYADTAGEGGGGILRSAPGWIMKLASNPLNYVKNLMLGPINKAKGIVADSPAWPVIKRAPGGLVKAATDKLWDIIPGWVKTAAGWAGNAAEWAVDGVKGAVGAAGDAASGLVGGVKNGAGAVKDGLDHLFKDGGILPYNGTMKYDSGGYLPPGLTSVVNLTGRPEPVFTADQFDGMQGGGGPLVGSYSPVFQGANMDAADVLDEFEFAVRKISRGSAKYDREGR